MMLTAIHQDALPRDPDALRDRMRALDEEWEEVREGHRYARWLSKRRGGAFVMPRGLEVVRGVVSLLVVVGLVALGWLVLIAERPGAHSWVEYAVVGGLLALAVGVFGWQTWIATHRYVRYRMDEGDYQRKRALLEQRLGTADLHRS